MAREGYIAIAVDNSCCEIGMVQGWFFLLQVFLCTHRNLLNIVRSQGLCLLHSGVCAPYFHSAFTMPIRSKKRRKMRNRAQRVKIVLRKLFPWIDAIPLQEATRRKIQNCSCPVREILARMYVPATRLTVLQLQDRKGR